MRRTTLLLTIVAAFAAVPGAAEAAGTLTIKKNIAKAGVVTAGWNQINCGLTCTQDAAHFANECDDQGCTPPEVPVNTEDRPGWAHAFSGCTDGEPEFCSMTMTTSRTVTVTYTDIANPTVTIGAPPQDSAVRGALQLTAQATDNDAVTRVEFFAGDAKVGEDTTPPYALSVDTASIADGARTFTAKAFDPSGRSGTAARRLVVDNGKPSVAITGGTAEGAKVGAPGDVSFALNAEDATTGVARLECALEGAAFTECNSRTDHAITGVAEGAQKFLVRAVDAAGNVSTTVARSFSVDKTSPALQIVSGPADGALIGAPGRAEYAFEAGDASGLAVVECAFDGSFGACEAGSGHGASPADGAHTFSVRATDTYGNVATVTRSLTVDTTAPSVTFTSGPAADSTIGPPADAAFTFATADVTSSVQTVECSVDGGAFGACESGGSHTLRGLAHGRHALAVRAIDAAGNARTVTRSFDVDVTAPETTIDSASAGSSAAFTFSASEAAATFRCRLYRTGAIAPAFGACAGASGSHSTSGLAVGDYVFEVIATDAFGNTDGSPARHAFTVRPVVDPPPPVERIGSDLTWVWKRTGKRTRLIKLDLTGIPAGATTQITCTGKGCPFKKKTIRFKATALDLARLLKKRGILPGGRIQVRVVKPGAIGKVVTLTMRKKGRPAHQVLCLPDGAAKPTAC